MGFGPAQPGPIADVAVPAYRNVSIRTMGAATGGISRAIAALGKRTGLHLGLRVANLDAVSQFIPIFQLLNEAKVRYVVVGGIATILHGYVRLTADVDLVIDLHAEEAQKAIRTLSGYGFKPRAPVDPLLFADATQRTRWIEEKGMEVFSLFHPDNPALTVDLFARHPIPFEPLWARSVLMNLGGVEVRVCSIDDLIEMKRRSGRHKDLADIEQLGRIKTYGKRSETE